jgi:hypothetical protein
VFGQTVGGRINHIPHRHPAPIVGLQRSPGRGGGGRGIDVLSFDQRLSLSRSVGMTDIDETEKYITFMKDSEQLSCVALSLPSTNASHTKWIRNCHINDIRK